MSKLILLLVLGALPAGLAASGARADAAFALRASPVLGLGFFDSRTELWGSLYRSGREYVLASPTSDPILAAC